MICRIFCLMCSRFTDHEITANGPIARALNVWKLCTDCGRSTSANAMQREYIRCQASK